MHPNAERIQELLTELGSVARVRELSASTRTSVEAAQAIGTTVAQIAKSLLFIAGDEPILIIASGTNRVSIEKIGRQTGRHLRRATADEVKEHTGYPIGGTPPIGHVSPLRMFIDPDLLAFGEIWAAAGTPYAVFSITPAELLRITGGQVTDLKDERVG